jgi:2-succinyl-5-enolpyruvyl-6-hydroxy-3-cyclohexene-1-carboxylate synthase
MSGDVLTRAVWQLVQGLADGGVREAVVAPGSRSTPLALAFFRHPRIQVYMHYDERSAAYFALGLAEAGSRPVVLVCTSGTAAANFLPAVVEASLTDVPLIVMTADRPPELREVGASQTIDQRHLYGTHVRWFYECPLPDPTLVGGSLFAATGLRAARQAATALRGPVHLNVPLREPLLIGDCPEDIRSVHPQNGSGAQTSVRLDGIVERLSGRRGIVVAGAEDLRAAGPAILSLAAHLHWPVAADPLSNLRTPGAPVLSHYDAWLTPPDWKALRLDAVVRFGPPPLSKALNQGLATVPLTLIDRAGRLRDPAFQTSDWVSVPDFACLEPLAGSPPPDRVPEPGADAFLQADGRACDALRAAIADLPGEGGPFEGALFFGLAQAAAGYRALLVGNSMPVRDLDTFASALVPRIFGQRGASGIDGVVSHGFGISAALGRTLIIVGDLSFFHDMNGLLAAHLHALPVTVLVINNAGGGIFSFLDQRAALPADEFEALFGTPHALDFERAAGVYGVSYERVHTAAAALAAVARHGAGSGCAVVEWRVATRDENLTFHRAAKDRARRLALGEEWPDAESRLR